MAPVGEAATAWASALGLLSSKKIDDALKLGADTQKKGAQSGVKLTVASGAVVESLALLCKTAAQPGADFITVLMGLEATWAETAALLACTSTSTSGAPGPWAKAAESAKALAAKASGESAKALQKATAAAKEVGVMWTEKLTEVTPQDLSSSSFEDDEASLKAAALAPDSITDPKQKAPALVRAALAQMKMKDPQVEDALKHAKQALATFRDLNDLEGEGTALQVVSAASLGTDAIGALSAANQSFKCFKEAGHCKGLVAAIHAVAKAYQGQQSSDDAIFRASEALKLSRQVGDRMREIVTLETLVEATLVVGNGKKALGAAQDAVAVARSIGNKLLEARSLCLLARAQGACGGGGAAAGVKSAKDALKLCQNEGMKDEESLALDAMAETCKAQNDMSEAIKCGQECSDKFRTADDKPNEAACNFSLASAYFAGGEFEQGVRVAQEAAACFKAAGDRKGEAMSLKLLAEARIALQDTGEAAKAAEQACMLYKNQAHASLDTRDAEINCIRMLVECNTAMGLGEEAWRVAIENSFRFKQLQDKKGEGSCFLMMARGHLARSDTDKAMTLLVQAPSLFAAVGDRRSEGEAWLMIAKIYLSKDEAPQAQRAAEQCSLAFRKLGDQRSRAQAAQVLADVHFALISKGMGNAQEALKAAQEAADLYEELGDQTQQAIALHVLANAQLMSKNFGDAIETAQAAETMFRGLRDTAGEAGSLLLQAGGFLGDQNFKEAKRCAKDAKDMYNSASDIAGEDTANDFLGQVQAYEEGEQSLEGFRGFSMKTARRTASGAKAPQASKPKKRGAQVSTSVIELVQACPHSKDSRVTMTLFDGFEIRTATEAQFARPEDQKDMRTGKKGGMKDRVRVKAEEVDYPDQVLFSVRWVQTDPGTSEAPGQRQPGRFYRKDEDKRVYVSGELGAPKENWGSQYSSCRESNLH